MYLDNSWLPLIYGLLASLVITPLVVIVVVRVAVARTRLGRPVGAALVIGAVVSMSTVGWLWTTSSPVDGYACQMSESLSSAFATAPKSSVDRGCLRDGRIKLAVGLGVEATLIGLVLVAVRRKPERQEAHQGFRVEV